MKRWIGLLLFLAILVPVLAQETATLEPTLTETPTPFPTLTEAATFAPTFTEPPTETATPISTFLPPETETPTLFSTETATLTPEFSSETATLTPTLTPTSWATETASPTLTATPEIVLVPFELTIPELPFTTLVPTEAVIELSIFFSNGTMEVALRDSGLGGYRVLLREDDQIGIFRDEELLGVIATSNLANIEHILRVSTLGNTFVFVLDGIELFNYVDVAPLADGNFQIITTGATVATAKVIGAWTSFTESAKEVPTMTNTPSAELLLVYSSTPTLTPEYYPSPTANNAQSFGVQAFGVTSSLPVKVVRVGTIANFYTALATANPSGNCVNNTYIQLTTGTLQRSGPLYATNGNNAFPIIKCPVTIIGSGNAGTTIIRPTAELTPYRFFAVDGSVTGQAHLTLQNIQLQGGYISQSDAAGGGAIIAVNGNVTLDRSRIFDNTVDVSQNLQTLGGGVYVFQGMLEVFSSIIRGNDVISPLPVPNTDGGGLAIVTGSINLQNNLIEQNTAERYGNLAYIQVSGSQGNAQRNCFFSPVISGAIDIYASSNTPLLGVTPPASGIGTPTLNPPPLSAPNNWWIATGTPGPRGTPYASPNAQGASINFGVQPYPFFNGDT